MLCLKSAFATLTGNDINIGADFYLFIFLFITLNCLLTNSCQAYAPGTGTPEIGGLTSFEAQQLIRGLAELDFVGGDMVEVHTYIHTYIHSSCLPFTIPKNKTTKNYSCNLCTLDTVLTEKKKKNYQKYSCTLFGTSVHTYRHTYIHTYIHTCIHAMSNTHKTMRSIVKCNHGFDLNAVKTQRKRGCT